MISNMKLYYVFLAFIVAMPCFFIANAQEALPSQAAMKPYIDFFISKKGSSPVRLSNLRQVRQAIS